MSSCGTTGMMFRQTSECSLIQYAHAFHCKKGLMGSIHAVEMRIENVVLAENWKSMIFKVGTSTDYSNSNLQKNWYISALARPDCPKCYNVAFGDVCKN